MVERRLQYYREGFELRCRSIPDPIRQRQLFCLHQGRDSVIFELDPNTGEHRNQLCTHLRYMEHHKGRTWPIDDLMLAFKLALETDPNLVNAATADCFPRGHQRPDLRGPVFLADWVRQPLPGMRKPEPHAVPMYPERHIRGIAPRFVAYDELKPLVRNAAERMRNIDNAMRDIDYDKLRDELRDLAQDMHRFEMRIDHDIIGLQAFFQPQPVEKIDLRLLDGIDRAFQLPAP